jgi:hypothetical protein
MITINKNTDKKDAIDFDVFNNYEDIIPDRMIDIDDVAGELIHELKEELKQRWECEYFEKEDQYYCAPVKHEKSFYSLLKFRINLLESFQNVLTSKELFALIYYTSFDAEEYVRPADRKWEIIKGIRWSSELEKFGVSNKSEFIEFLENIDPILFYELIQILLDYQIIGYCPFIERTGIDNLSKSLETINVVSPNLEEPKNNLIK